MIKTDLLSAADVPYIGAYYVVNADHRHPEGKIIILTDKDAFNSAFDLFLLTEEQFQEVQSTDMIIW